MGQRIRLKIGENEIEVEGDEKFIEKHLQSFTSKYSFLKTGTAKEGSTKLPAKVIAVKDKGGKDLSPAEFVRQKSPKGGTEQVIVLAKYLEDHESSSEFSVKDINRVARVAKIKKIDNSYYPLAVKQGLLNKIARGKYQLTLTGEDAVLAMSSSTE